MSAHRDENSELNISTYSPLEGLTPSARQCWGTLLKNSGGRAGRHPSRKILFAASLQPRPLFLPCLLHCWLISAVIFLRRCVLTTGEWRCPPGMQCVIEMVLQCRLPTFSGGSTARKSVFFIFFAQLFAKFRFYFRRLGVSVQGGALSVCAGQLVHCRRCIDLLPRGT